jgi:hypothetical protein
VEQCEQAGLVWGKELSVDSTKVLANASVGSMAPRFAVEAHLETLFGSQSQEAESHSEQADEGQASPTMLPTALAEDPSEQLGEVNSQRHDWIAEAGRQNRAVVDHDSQRIADFEASTTDPDASRVPSG